MNNLKILEMEDELDQAAVEMYNVHIKRKPKITIYTGIVLRRDSISKLTDSFTKNESTLISEWLCTSDKNVNNQEVINILNSVRDKYKAPVRQEEISHNLPNNNGSKLILDCQAAD